MEFDGGFSFVHVDSVNVAGFSGVEMVCWVKYKRINWHRYADSLIVLALDPGTEFETVLLGPDHRPHAADPEDQWIEYQAPLEYTNDIIMEFGGSFKGGGAAWFDHLQLRGYGRAENTSTICGRGGCPANGTEKALGDAVCRECPPGRFDDDLDPSTLCLDW